MQEKALPRILPFAIFMAFIGIEGGLRLVDEHGFTLSPVLFLYLYPVKILCVSWVLLFYRRHYREVEWRDFTKTKFTLASILTGFLIFILWINLDFSFATQGTPAGFNPDVLDNELLRFAMITVRIAGAALLVPIMEELFWRSFLIRYIITSDFSRTAIGTFTWASFLVTALLFGLEHHYILAGIVAGVLFNLLLYYTKSIVQCILSHAVANLALALYVLHTGEWRFW